MFGISDSRYHSIEQMAKKVTNKEEIYSLLLSNLPTKLKFNIIYGLSQNILGRYIIFF